MVDRADLALVGGYARLADVGGGGDPDNAIRAWLHLAGQDVALGRLLLGHGVFDVASVVVFARLAEALAGPAGAVPAIERDVDPDPIGRVRDGFSWVSFDEAGDS